MKKENWKRKNKKEINSEFDRLLDCLINQGDVEVISNMISFNTKKVFIIGWHDNDGLDQ